MRHVPTSSYPANLSESQVPGMLSAQSEGTQIGVRRSDSCCPQPKAEKREEEGQVRRLLIHLPNCPPSHLHHPAPSPPPNFFYVHLIHLVTNSSRLAGFMYITLSLEEKEALAIRYSRNESSTSLTGLVGNEHSHVCFKSAFQNIQGGSVVDWRDLRCRFVKPALVTVSKDLCFDQCIHSALFSSYMTVRRAVPCSVA